MRLLEEIDIQPETFVRKVSARWAVARRQRKSCALLLRSQNDDPAAKRSVHVC